MTVPESKTFSDHPKPRLSHNSEVHSLSYSQHEPDEIDELTNSKDNFHKNMDEEQCALLLQQHLHQARDICNETKCPNCLKTENVI